jgi:DNA-directed RNA polymerase specialized sigma24 family protein
MPRHSDKIVDWEDLLRRTKSGDEEAREKLFLCLRERLRRLARSILWSWSDADIDDLIHDTLEVIHNKLALIESRPQAFAGRTMQHKIWAALQKKKIPRSKKTKEEGESSFPIDRVIPLSLMGDLAGDSTIEAQVIQGDLIKHIQNAVAKLGKFCQQFFCYAIENEDAADAFKDLSDRYPNLSRSAFDTKVFRCRHELKAKLSEVLKDTNRT